MEKRLTGPIKRGSPVQGSLRLSHRRGQMLFYSASTVSSSVSIWSNSYQILSMEPIFRPLME